MKECPRCLMTSDIATIPEVTIWDDSFMDENGRSYKPHTEAKQCEYCDLHDTLEAQRDPSKIQEWIDHMKLDGQDSSYDCLIGVSGGFDSSLLWYMAVKDWGLRPLVLHFDNRQNEPIAEANIRALEAATGIEAMWHRPKSMKTYNKAVEAMLRSGTPDADIVNDIYMTKLMYEVAAKHGIHWIINGHNYRTEGSTPKSWTKLDSGYLARIYKHFTGERLPSEYRLTILDQVRYGIKGIRNIRPYYHMNLDLGLAKKRLSRIGWRSYGAKHAENKYTLWVGYKLLPVKFGIDKRRVYLSAQVRSGELTKAEARVELRKSVKVEVAETLLMAEMLAAKPVARDVYGLTNYKRYKWLIWLLVKLEVLPYTFYIKYCK